MNTASERKQISDMNAQELIQRAVMLHDLHDSGDLSPEHLLKCKQNLITVNEAYRQITDRPLTKETIERELK